MLLENSLWLEYVYTVEPWYVSNLWNAGHFAQVRIVPNDRTHNHWNTDIYSIKRTGFPVPPNTRTVQTMIHSMMQTPASVLNVTSRVLYFIGCHTVASMVSALEGFHCSSLSPSYENIASEFLHPQRVIGKYTSPNEQFCYSWSVNIGY